MTEVTRRWLEAPYELDGWRVDVANMVGRYREFASPTSVAREIRQSVGEKLLVAEHGHDFRADLQGDGWHGSMNYSGFLRPVWTWLRGDDLPEELLSFFWSIPIGLPRLAGGGRRGDAQLPRRAPLDRVLHSWVLLDSHDTARFRTVAGSREAQLVGVGLQMTTPGVPMVFAGDELGLEGAWGEDARRTMPWSRPDTWDTTTFEGYRALIALRRSSAALAHGGHAVRPRLGRRDRVPARGAGRAAALPGRPRRARPHPPAARCSSAALHLRRSTAATPTCAAATRFCPATAPHSMSGDSRDQEPEGGPSWLKWC